MMTQSRRCRQVTGAHGLLPQEGITMRATSAVSQPQHSHRRGEAAAIVRTTVNRTLSGLAAAALLIAALGGCGGTATGPATPRLALSACVVQGVAARCGSLSVAENPAQPVGPKIALRVVVLPATTADRAADPLFYLEGGPGGAASDEAQWVAQHFTTLN